MHCIVSVLYQSCISSILRRTYSEQISSNFIMHSTLCIMHCKAFFEPPSNHLRITSEQTKTQKYPKYAEKVCILQPIMHSSLCIMQWITHSSLCIKLRIILPFCTLCFAFFAQCLSDCFFFRIFAGSLGTSRALQKHIHRLAGKYTPPSRTVYNSKWNL